jgi:membrane-bound serine protease (ClpP class)
MNAVIAMRRLAGLFGAWLLAGICFGADESDDSGDSAAERDRGGIFVKAEPESLAGKVVVLHVGQDDLVNKQTFKYWHSVLDRASADGARAVVLELDTPGGLAFDTRNLIVDDFAKLDIPLIAWVEREAISAGALIAFAADRIYMAPGTTIGSAGLVSGTGQEIEKVMRAKLESVFEASMRSVVKKKGHRMEVLRAMMFVDEDKEREIGPVTVRKGGLLNLTAEEAVTVMEDGEPLLAEAVVKDLDAVLEREGMGDAEIVRPEPTGFERFAWWIAALSPILIALGIGAAYLELKAPGFGIFGFVALGVFALFFFGNNIAGNLAGWELTAVFVVGVLLILLEILVLPGMIAGAIGGVMVLGSLWFAMADRVDFDRAAGEGRIFENLGELLTDPGLLLALGLLGGVILAMVLLRYVPNLPLFRQLVATEELKSGPGEDASEASSAGEGKFVGRTGIALTSLRPSGTILVDGARKDAVSHTGWIEKDSKIRVCREGMTFVVEEVKTGS